MNPVKFDYICNFARAVRNNFTAEHIKRLPNTPRQNGSNSILSFYASLPSGRGALPTDVLATIFVTEQDNILPFVDSELENARASLPSSETPILTTAQTNNLVSITIFNFKPMKVSRAVKRSRYVDLSC